MLYFLPLNSIHETGAEVLKNNFPHKQTNNQGIPWQFKSAESCKRFTAQTRPNEVHVARQSKPVTNIANP